MNDMVTDTAPLSTQLEDTSASSPSGGGAVPKEAVEPVAVEPKKPESVRDSLEAESKAITEAESKEQDDKVDDTKADKGNKEIKAKEPVKVEPKADKSAASEQDADATAQTKDQPQERKSEVRERPEPPARFLPKAKEVWRNVPQAVQSEVSRMVQDHEQEVSQYRESHQFREELREYEEMGKQHGMSVKQALDNYVGIERKFAEAPSEGFKQLLGNLKMPPQQAISHILQAYGVSPQALAQHMAQQPEQYAAQQRQAPQQQQSQEDPRVNQLQQQLMDMQAQIAHQQFIEPFAREHPRYAELESDIAFFLQSGKIPVNMSAAEKLAAAYDMAERINPSSNVEYEQEQPTLSRVDDDSNGNKSVKSSPGNVLNVAAPERKMSMRELLEDELRRSKRA
jgi:hypothetical protein